MRVTLFRCAHCHRDLSDETDERCPDHPDGARIHIEIEIEEPTEDD
jgi:hypothetical protein